MNIVANSGKLVISTWFVGDQVGEESLYPQMGMPSSRIEFQRVYWQCIWLLFKTAQYTNPDSPLVLFVDSLKHPLCQEFRSGLEKMGVSIVAKNFESRPPRGFTDRFGNQLFICDIVRHIAAGQSDADDVWLVLDSDCLILENLRPLFEATRTNGALTLDIGITSDEEINGLSPRKLGQIGFDLEVIPVVQPIPYFGGEIFSASKKMCTQLSPLLDRLLQSNVTRWRQGKEAIREEAHLLSLSYAKLGISAGTANLYIRQIWTTLKYSNASEKDLSLAIWHVPAEKRYGFARMYKFAIHHGAEFELLLKGEAFSEWAGRMLGIPRRTLGKTIRDIAAKIWQRLVE